MFDSMIQLLSLARRRRGPGDALVAPPSSDPRWMKWVGALWIANFVAFALASTYFGGSALNGYTRDGHYFLGAHSHGPFIEVSRNVYLYSKWHAIVMFVWMIAFMLFYYGRKRRATA
jgi:hypothetical protein